ncbi:MAG: bile acid:sodium symporter family protein [Spongiibacteraceae bacterium]|jgi:sodium/bile acid cotransporter 7|nr:bile acid:sodium symporter family protein [Spongiibacteraceae bacterium]
MKFKIDPLLQAMAVAIALAFIYPPLGASGGPLYLDTVTHYGIGLVFFLHGAALSRQSLVDGLRSWRLHLLVQSSTFLVFPLAGFAIYFLTAPGWLTENGLLTPDLRLGLFFLSAVPSTIAGSIAVTMIARGNLPAAIFNATISGLIGMVLTPALVGVVVATGGTELDVLSAIVDVFLTLLLPFAIGHLLRPWIGATLTRHKRVVSIIERGVVVLIVYVAFCNSAQARVWATAGVWVVLAVGMLVVLWLVAALAYNRAVACKLGFSTEDEIVALFCGTQKSLANGAPIANILFAGWPGLSMILLPLILYHQLQLLFCVALAQRYAQRH